MSLIETNGDTARSGYLGYWSSPPAVAGAIEWVLKRAWGDESILEHSVADNGTHRIRARATEGTAELMAYVNSDDLADLLEPQSQPQWSNAVTGKFLADEVYASSAMAFAVKAPDNDVETLSRTFASAIHVALGELPGPKVSSDHRLATLWFARTGENEALVAAKAFTRVSAKPLKDTELANARAKEDTRFGVPERSVTEAVRNVWREDGNLDGIDSPVAVFFVNDSPESVAETFHGMGEADFPIDYVDWANRQFALDTESTIWPMNEQGIREQNTMQVPFRVVEVTPGYSAVLFNVDPYASHSESPQTREPFPHLFKVREARLGAMMTMFAFGRYRVLLQFDGERYPVFTPSKESTLNLREQPVVTLNTVHDLTPVVAEVAVAQGALETEFLRTLERGAKVNSDLPIPAGTTWIQDTARYFPDGVVSSLIGKPPNLNLLAPE